MRLFLHFKCVFLDVLVKLKMTFVYVYGSDRLSLYLNESDYYFEEFQSNGMSGTIYIGTPKRNKTLSKILVKNNELQFAANEFFALQIASLLDIHAPKSWFVLGNEGIAIANRKFAVGIEFLNGLSKVTDDILNSEPARKEFIECILLHVCCNNSDTFQMAVASDNHIIPFDFAECFLTSPFKIVMLLLLKDKADKFMQPIIANYDYLMQFDSQINFIKNRLLKQYRVISEEEFNETAKLFAQKLVALPHGKIIDILTPIEEYYSKEVADYYELYLKCMQKNIQGLLK